MELQQILHMNRGEGDTSYAKNSSYQNSVLTKVKPALEQCLRELLRANLPNINKCLKVADLGCASGPNTVLTVWNIIQSVDKVGQEKKNAFEPPTIQIFLNDLFQNDFNSVFKSLPSFYRKLEKENGRKIGSCLIAAMPGSFYGRLFPEESMHFLHPSYSLHWLSQVFELIPFILFLSLVAKIVHDFHSISRYPQESKKCKKLQDLTAEPFALRSSDA
ncbi:monomethylxanthine methyltransferase 1-like [Coffea eugenioides]|uniref:monomethylxanthine methyltransferase 1-like n=1 Tax=Coffea eugenioides TaxID=49369 RepID=UPI000F60788C|nr:monomethylxanthine methyltransferase 1-like [Coffea eugenioides]